MIAVIIKTMTDDLGVACTLERNASIGGERSAMARLPQQFQRQAFPDIGEPKMSQKPLDRARLEEQRAAFMQALVGTFQARFHVLNKAGGLMQKDIAERLGKDPGYVSRMLAGQKNMTIQTAHDLARAMDSRLEMTLKPYEEMVPTDNRPHRGATSFDDLSGFSNTKAAKYAGPETNYATGS